MSNPDTILFSGTVELSATTVANLLTTEKYVTIEGYDSIAPNAFKDKTDIITVTISNSVTTIGLGAFVVTADANVTAVKNSLTLTTKNVTITGTANVLPTGSGLTLNTVEPGVITWNDIIPGATMVWKPIKPY